MIKAGSCIRCIVAAGLSVITITAFGLQIVKADSRGRRMQVTQSLYMS